MPRLHELLDDAAGAPLEELDLDRLRARAAAYRRHRTLTRIGAPVAALAMVALVTGALVSGGGSASRVIAPTIGAPRTTVTPALVPTRFTVGGVNVSAVASGVDAVWVGGERAPCNDPSTCGVVARVDPTTGRILATVSIGDYPLDIAVGGDGIWVLSDLPNGSPYRLARINPATNQVDVTTTIVSAVVGNTNPGAHLAVGAGAVWVALTDGGVPRLVRVDPATGRTVATTTLLDGDAAHAIAVDASGVWIEAFGNGHLTHVDPTTNQITGRVELGDGFLNSIAADDTAVWATQGPVGSGSSTLVRVDPPSGQIVARLPIPATIVAVGDGQVFVSGYNPDASAADAQPGYVGRVDPATNTIAQTTHIATTLNETQILTVGAAGTWIGTGDTSILDRIAGPPSPSSSLTPEGCPTTFTLPFIPSYLPAGWRPVQPHTAHATPGTDFIEVWSGTAKTASPYGIIEVWRGADIPTPRPPTTDLTLFGHPAQLGLISDGSSVVFNTGAAPDPCTRWALVAHPGTTPQILRNVAEQLVPATPPANMPTIEITGLQTIPGPTNVRGGVEMITAGPLAVSFIVTNISTVDATNIDLHAQLSTQPGRMLRDFVDLAPGQRIAVTLRPFTTIGGQSGTLTVTAWPHGASTPTGSASLSYTFR